MGLQVTGVRLLQEMTGKAEATTAVYSIFPLIWRTGFFSPNVHNVACPYARYGFILSLINSQYKTVATINNFIIWTINRTFAGKRIRVHTNGRVMEGVGGTDGRRAQTRRAERAVLSRPMLLNLTSSPP